MEPYIYLYLILVTTWIFYQQFKKANIKYILSGICLLILWGFVAFRELNVGSDTYSFCDFYKSPYFLYNGGKTDIGFEYLSRILKLISNNVYFFISVISTIYMYGLYFIIKKSSVDIPLSVFLFCIVGSTVIFLFHYLTIIRQATSLSFFFISVWIFFEKEKTKTNIIKAIILYVIAISMHKSTLFTLPFLFIIWKIKFSPKLLIILVIFTYYLGAQQWVDIKSLLSSIFGFIGNDGHYSSYADISFGQREVVGLFNMNILPFSLWAVVIASTVSEKTLNIWYVKFFLLSVILNNVFSNNLIWDRLILGFSIFIILAIPRVIMDMKQFVKVPFLIIFISYYIYKTMNQLLSTYEVYINSKIIDSNYIPYHNWLLGF